MTEENKPDEVTNPCAQGHSLGTPVENVRVIPGSDGSTITTYTRVCTRPGCGHAE